ncbi:MAG: type VI secretion system baseplate subunit TssF [Steroidobacteraceae bacterium]
MDPRLLNYYNLELQHLREMGAEFAQQFPKIAARLGMNGLEVADPYVERLLEGMSFLAARIQLKLDAEFPRFTQSLLEMVYPQFLAPVPSMLVAQLQPDPKEPNLASGFTVPRGTAMQSLLAKDELTTCEFRTAQDVRLWPLEVASASYFSHAPDLPLGSLPVRARIRAGVRLRLKTTAGVKFQQLGLETLRLYLTGREDVANRLHEFCAAASLGTLVLPGRSAPAWYEFSPAPVQRVGFADEEALLPATLRSFQGYRLLQEYFAFPQRFRFLDIPDLARGIQRVEGEELELVVLLGRGDAVLESLVDAANFALFCTPAINLFPKRADRIHVTDASSEYHVVPDRTRPLDYEVYEVSQVTGHGVGADSEQTFRPFYGSYAADVQHYEPAYFTVRREPRLPSSTQQRRGPRSSYIGTEVFLALVDPSQAPFRGDLRQLSVQTLCTNRDLVLHIPMGAGKSDFTLDVAAPVVGIRVVSGPSRPFAPLTDGAVAWRAVSNLSLNYLSLVDSSPSQGAAALRELLELYAPSLDATARRQIEGIKSVQVRPIVRRLPAVGPLTFGRGLEIAIEVDELAFEGGSAYLLGCVLEQFLARHVSINSFTETALNAPGRGEIARWVPKWGTRPTL